MVEPRWYVIDKIGTATLCADAEDARDVSMTSDQAYPQNAPHRAVQLVAVTSMESVRAQHSRDSKMLREALNWTAAALQAACSMPEPIRERGDITIHGETRTIGVILDSADAALAQEKS